MLRLLVEKSELWVFKKKGDGKKEKVKIEEDEPATPVPTKSFVEVCSTPLLVRCELYSFSRVC